MPPKKADKGSSKKVVEKQKQKVIEDKTFGLKNKKGAKQQKFIEIVEKQVRDGGKKKTAEDSLKTKKENKLKELDEINLLFRPTAQKISRGADPKSVLCAFFKQGQCTKGAKCKFSHDLLVQRKSEKKSMYADERDQDEDCDTMENWDDEKLHDVVKKKHSNESTQLKTSIVCKHFIEAVESNKYGWFWECPNGGTKCMYRHALPPGFVLRKDQKRMAEQNAENQLTIEELIETERANLSKQFSVLHPVTLDSFLRWKQRKIEQKKRENEKQGKKKKEDFKEGRTMGITGRQMFSFQPDMVDNDDAEAGDTIEREYDEEDTDKGTELTLESLAAQATEQSKPVKGAMGGAFNGTADSGDPIALAEAAVSAPTIDEDLFNDELDGLEDDLDILELDEDSSD